MKYLTFISLIICLSARVYSQNDTTNASYKDYLDIRDYVQSTVAYPHYAIENDIDGIVVYSVKVTKSGCVDSILFKQTPHESFNQEIIKVLRKTKCKWKPAYYNNEPIDIWINTEAVFLLYR